DAAQAAALVLEDDPLFNAGTGGALSSAGEVELDASCMDGTSLRAGAVACIKTTKNPILAARRVCDDTPHVLLCGPGAEAFARECGIPEYRNELLVTARQRARWQELHALAHAQGADAVRAGAIGTIGAVADDARADAFRHAARRSVRLRTPPASAASRGSIDRTVPADAR